MALNGTKVVINGGYKLTFYWQRTAYSPDKATSTIGWSLTFSVTGTSAFTEVANPKPEYSITVDGNTYTGTASIGLVTTGQSKALASGTTVIQHTNKGSEKNFNFSFTQNLQGLGTMKGSGSGTLDAIPVPGYIISGDNFYDNENPSIAYFGGREVDALDVCIADINGIDIYINYRSVPIVEDGNGTYTFELTEAERAKLIGLAGGSTFVFKYYIRTKIGSQLYFRSRQATLFTTESELSLNPTVEEGNSAILALTGDSSKLILGYSTANYTIGASTTSGASITSQSVICGNTKKTAATGSFTYVQNNVFSFSATDNKGNTKTKTLTLDTVPYIPVTCNQQVKLNMDGTASLNISGNYFDGSFGAQNNSLTIEIRSREDGGAWTAWGDITVLLREASGGTYTLTGTISGYDPSGTYEFESRATDKLKTAYSAGSSIVLKPVFDWGRNDFNFNVPVTIEDNPLNDYVIETGTTAMGSNGTWYWSKWKSGKAECYGCRNYGNMDVSTDWGGWFRSGSFSQDLPYGLFANTPEVIDINLRQGSSGGWVVRYEYEAPDNGSTGSFIIVRPKSAVISQAYISFNIIGRWK
jgi:hypothetical protein